jgi:hypothetical protein
MLEHVFTKYPVLTSGGIAAADYADLNEYAAVHG